MIYMGKDRGTLSFIEYVRANLQRQWDIIRNQHNYFTSIRPATSLCGHGRVACIDCHGVKK